MVICACVKRSSDKYLCYVILAELVTGKVLLYFCISTGLHFLKTWVILLQNMTVCWRRLLFCPFPVSFLVFLLWHDSLCGQWLSSSNDFSPTLTGLTNPLTNEVGGAQVAWVVLITMAGKSQPASFGDRRGVTIWEPTQDIGSHWYGKKPEWGR